MLAKFPKLGAGVTLNRRDGQWYATFVVERHSPSSPFIMSTTTGRKLRVLFVADVSPVRVIGGAERVLYEHMRRLAQGGHEVHCLARAEGRTTATLVRMEGIIVHHFPWRSRFPVLSLISALWNCRTKSQQLLQDHPFDLINFHQPLSALGVLAACKSRKIPKLYTFHSLWFREYEVRATRSEHQMDPVERPPSGSWIRFNAWLRKVIERACLKAADRILVLSEFSREQLLKYHRVPASRIALVPGGVDTDRFIPLPAPQRRAIRKGLEVPEEAFLLLTVRNLERRMGLENLLQAMASVVAQRPDLYLIVGGAGPLENELHSLASHLGLEPYVRFEGFIPEAKLPEYYQAADLFLLPTRCLEGFGLVTVEALACGTPVVGTPLGGTVEILSGLDPDLLCKGPEPEEIAEKVLQFLSRSEEDLQGLRGRCRQFALAHYDWDPVVEKVAAQMEALVDPSRGRAGKGW